jgi:hypothetical protein
MVSYSSFMPRRDDEAAPAADFAADRMVAFNVTLAGVEG